MTRHWWNRWNRATLILGATGLLAIGLVACSGDDDDDARSATDDATTTVTAEVPDASATEQTGASDGFKGGIASPPIKKPPITLTDQDGQPFDLPEQTEGEITLFYVGYTNCPDVCPTHLATAAAAIEQLPDDVKDQVNLVFATADPERDTPEVLKEYLAQFNPNFIGLTGTEEQMVQVQQFFGLGVAERVPDESSEGGYGLNHMSLVIAYGQDDLGHIVFPSGMPIDTWIHDLTLLAREGFSDDA